MSSEKPFAEFLGHRRRELRLTQMKIAEASQEVLSQPVVSSWETGATTPRIDDSRISILARILQISVERLEAFVGEQIAARGEVSRLPDLESLLREAQGCIEQVNEAEVWVLNPQTSFFIDSRTSGGQWSRNLAAGVSYHVVCVLDVIEPMELYRIMQLVLQVAQLESASGKVHLHGVRLVSPLASGESTQTFAECEAHYNVFRSQSISGMVCHELCNLSEVKSGDPDEPFRAQAVGILTGLGTTMLVKPKAIWREPLALFYLASAGSRRKGPFRPLAYLHAVDTCWALRLFVDRFEHHVSTSEQTASPASVVN